MTPRGDLLGESVPPAMHDHDGLLLGIDHGTSGLREGLDCGEWPGAESNCRHADFQSAALPTELPGRRTRNFISTNHFRKRERQWFVDAHRSQWDLQWDSLSAEVTLRNQRVLARFAAFLFHHFPELGRI